MVSSRGGDGAEASTFNPGAENELANATDGVTLMLILRIVINIRFIGLTLEWVMQLLLAGTIDLKLANSHECIPV